MKKNQRKNRNKLQLKTLFCAREHLLSYFVKHCTFSVNRFKDASNSFKHFLDIWYTWLRREAHDTADPAFLCKNSTLYKFIMRR